MHKTGLVLGKFMPLHKGHIELIRFACARVEKLILLICAHQGEPIPGESRRDWAREVFKDDNVEVHLMEYDKNILPDSSVSSIEHSRPWADYLRQQFPGIDIIFSSEQYGEYIARMLKIQHGAFDLSRKIVPVAASLIRQSPFKYWNYIPEVVRPFFVKKICILGSESTGKSTLTQRLAGYFQTIFVPEVAREIVDKTEDVVADDLNAIATQHANAIIENIPRANRLLFIDTDINITKSYSRFLFNNRLEVDSWIEKANVADLYLYLETDCDYVQDGTRLSIQKREELNQYHKQQLADANIRFHIINGDWENRFSHAVKIIQDTYLNN